MAKALVIQGVNFSTNAVAHITFDDPIPCTGISFSSDTVNITDYDPVTIAYTVTPNDTTDEVIWSSTDADVVSVADGVLTVNGIGTCTVTASCGNYSASAMVTVSIEYIENYVFGQLSAIGQNGAGSIGTSDTRVSALGSGAQLTDYKLANSSGMSGDNYPILLPKNTAYVRAKFTSVGNIYDSNTGALIAFYKNEDVGEGTLSSYIKILSDASVEYNAASEATKIVAVPSGAEAVGFRVRIKSAGESTAAQIMAAAGFTFEFLTAAEVSQ